MDTKQVVTGRNLFILNLEKTGVSFERVIVFEIKIAR